MTSHLIEARDVPPLSMRAAVQPGSVDRAARTVDVVWTTGARVRRGFFDAFDEELSLDPKHVRLERLNSGRAPLLDNHQQFGSSNNVRGVVVAGSAKVNGKIGTATVRFPKAEDDADADQIFRKIADGIIGSCSVGYRVHKMEEVEAGKSGAVPVFRAIDWEPFELSAVALPADAGAGFRSETSQTNRCEFSRSNDVEPKNTDPLPDATDPGVLAERARALEIRKLVRVAHLDTSIADELIANNSTVDAARKSIWARLVAHDEEFQINPHHRMETGGGSDERGARVKLMAEALTARFGGPAPSAEARQYIRMSLTDMAKHLLEARGVSARMLSKSEVISRSILGGHTSSDFSGLLVESGSRFLRQGFGAYVGGLQRVARKTTAPDFRAKSRLLLGEAPTLVRVNEHGEFKSGSIAASKESYSLATYGRIFGVTRQAIINDDLGAFGEMIPKFGRAAAEFISQQLVNLLTQNAGLGPTMEDGLTLFHADHHNIGAPAPLSILSLSADIALMRRQVGLDGLTPVDTQPKYLIVPTGLELIARQLVTTFTASKATDVNPWAGMIEVVVDPRLDVISATRSYIACDPMLFDSLEYSFLEGEEGPQFETREGFEIDGLEFKVRLDFGAGAVEHRGLVSNEGV